MANQITVLLDPTQMPNQSQDQATFDALFAGVLAALPALGAQINAIVANLNSIAAGGAYAIPYSFDAGTADSDPGLGKLRVDSAIAATGTIVGASGFLRADTSSSAGQDFAALIDTFDGSTSTIKGSIRLVKITDPTKWAIFDVTSLAKPSGYRNIGVTVRAASSASPFAANDSLILFFQRTGDKGDAGPLTSVLWVRDEKASGTQGGACTAGSTVQRALNTIKRNTISGASLTANQVTLPAGTYRISMRAPSVTTGPAQAWLYNVTDGTVLITGSSTGIVAPGASISCDSIISNCEVVLSAQKVLEVRHYTYASSSPSGLGGASSSGQTEVYTELFINKVT